MKKNAGRVTNIVTGIILLLGAGTLFYSMASLYQDNAALQSRVDGLRQIIADEQQIISERDDQISNLLEQYTELSDECEAAADCEATTPDPAVIERVIERSMEGMRGPAGPTGPEPTIAQILDALRLFCGTGDCIGPSGPPGVNGADGTNGLNGTDGTNGSNGIDGAQGPAGPAGPPGADGLNGLNGADGRGVTNVACEGNGSDSTFVFTFTDGTTQSVGGPCNLAILP